MMQRNRIIVPKLIVHANRVRRPAMRVGIKPQHLRWELGSYKDRLSFGPGGRGRRPIWTPARVGEQHNLVLDAAYDLVPTAGFTGLNMYAAVGSGSTAPSASDTALESEIAVSGASPPSGESDVIEEASDYTYTIRRVRQFSTAQVGGHNLTEWAWGPTSSGNRATRELFRDDNGDPVTLTPATDQELRLIYAIAVQLSPQPDTGVSQSFDLTNVGTFNGQYWLTAWDPKAPLQFADYLARGKGVQCCHSGSGAYWMPLKVAMSPGDGRNPQQWDYMHSIALEYESYAAGSRKRTVLDAVAGVDDWQYDIYGLAIAHQGSDYAADHNNGLYFDFGGSFTKDNLHKLIINSFDVISW